MESEIALFILALLLTCSPPDLTSFLFAARLYSLPHFFFPVEGAANCSASSFFISF